MNSVLRFVIASACLVAASGCVTTNADGVVLPKKEPDLEEAARLNTQLGVDYMRRGQNGAALEKLKRALDQDEQYAPAHTAIALIYADRGEHRAAEKHYRRALSLRPDDPAVRNNFGAFLCERGKHEAADRNFLEAARNPQYQEPAKAWLNAGVCARRVPDLKKAERYFRQALKIVPQSPDALGQMAWVSLQQQDYLSARAFLQRYQQVARMTPETLLVGYQTETALGDARAAFAYADRLRRDFPDSKERKQLSQSSSS